MRCPQCQADNRGRAQFCRACGGRLERVCPSCGARAEPDSKFCDACGAGLVRPAGPSRFATPGVYTPPHLAEKILTSRSALEGERKQVTVLFCDLANSTALAERLGPEAMHALLNEFFELALAEVHRYEGTINQFLGDGFMALFGAPVAHEDHARRAVLAALGIRRALRERPEEADTELAVRMGLNTGLVVVGKIGDNLRMDYTAVGDTTNLAARLQQVAEPGTILVSEATERQVRGYMRLEALKPVQVKGKAEAVPAYRILGVGPRRSPLEGRGERVLSRFVARERELAALHEMLAQAEAGQGQTVGLQGEPGMGKSRLLYEFRQGLAGRRITYLEGRCLSYGSVVPYLPLIDIVRSNCGIADADRPEVIAEKLQLGLREVGMDAETGTPYLFHLLGVKEGAEPLAVLSPEAIKTRTFETLRQMSLRGSRRRPIILAVEDLHWIDKTSEEYLASLMESLPGASILVLATYRPGYRPPWMEKSYATQLALRPLSPPDSLHVVRSVVEGEPLAEAVAGLILEKAEGNPFFLEELTRAVAEHRNLSVPDTIQGVLMARIDRLPEEAKHVLQTASVLGREFSLGLLCGIWDGPEGPAPRLAELARLEFVYERPGAEEPTFVFKHALTQEVAYASLLTPRRQTLHGAAGRTLEALYTGRLDEAADRLAHHYARTDDAGKAVEYLSRVADKAARGYAHAEAAAAFREALVHAERLPTEERDRRVLELVLRLAWSLHFLGRRQESVNLLGQHQERLERLGDASLIGPYFFTLGFAYSFLGNRELAGQSMMRAFAAAVESGDQVTMGKVKTLVGMERAWTGRLGEGVELHRQAVAHLEPTGERWWLGWAHYMLAYTSLGSGDFDQAQDEASRVESIAIAMGDRRLQAFAASIRGSILAPGEPDAAIRAHERALDLSPDPFETALFLGYLGYAYLEKGDRAQAVAVLEKAVDQANRYRSEQVRGWFATWLGRAYLLDGQLDRARDTARRGLDVCREVNFAFGIGEGQHALGLIALASGALDEAETWITQALETFGAMEARFYMGRMHLALASVANARGDREALGIHLDQAHARFTASRVQRYVGRTEELARQLDVALSSEGYDAH